MTQAIVRRPTAHDSLCDRCYEDIPEGEIAGYVEPGLHGVPWVAGTVLCSRCSDRVAYKYLRECCDHATLSHDAEGCLRCDCTETRGAS